jgi:preprotein translocase subunit SecA
LSSPEARVREDEAIQGSMVTRAIEQAQAKTR